MRRLLLVVLAVLALPSTALAASRTETTLRLKTPAPANATVAGFKLNLVKVRKRKAKKASLALAHLAARLPKDVTVYAVVAKQKRSDRVQGVVVAVNRAEAVAAPAARSSRRIMTVNLQHAAVPKGFKLVLTLRQTANVLNGHGSFPCGKYFKSSDLGGAIKLAGRRVPGITIGTIIQSACASAKSRKPYPTEGEFRAALNARSGTISLVRSASVPNEVDGTATFNYSTDGFGVISDAKHQFTGCAFAAGTCTVSSGAHPNDTILLRPSTEPAPSHAVLTFAVSVSPSSASPLPFQFFGLNHAGVRFGPLLTTGP